MMTYARFPTRMTIFMAIQYLLALQFQSTVAFQTNPASRRTLSFAAAITSTPILSSRGNLECHAPPGISTRSHNGRRRRNLTSCWLVTEEDVLEAVEEAEKLWAKALEARKEANALSDRAEEEAEAAANSSKEADSLIQSKRENKEPITVDQLQKADAAARSSLDAGSMVNKALQASEEADKLEKLAEEALQKSEEQLEQHLKDFPDSKLAD
mmetsp:Transcript_29438/g.84617  ORF Transcript_29438/g.84617 Transcript_29438/m.84617 type:complete len:212 (+) Transcript_29438:200-835(+)